MKCLKIYTVDLPSHLQPVLDSMKSNGVQLDHFGFTVDINDVIEEKFTSTQQLNHYHLYLIWQSIVKIEEQTPHH